MEQPGFIVPGKENPESTMLKQVVQGIHDVSRISAKCRCPCVFIRNVNGQLAVVAVQVDDLILLTKTEQEINDLKSSLAARFKMKDMGKFHYCLGVNIKTIWTVFCK